MKALLAVSTFVLAFAVLGAGSASACPGAAGGCAKAQEPAVFGQEGGCPHAKAAASEGGCAMAKEGGCAMAKEGGCPHAKDGGCAMKDGECACKKDGKCDCPMAAKGECPCKKDGTCPCKKDGKCDCPMAVKGECPCKKDGKCACGKDEGPKAGVAVPADMIGKDATCPVSGEKFKITAKTPYSVVDGTTYYFCCPNCKPKFDKDPAKFIKKAK